jgi:hypothetical protein
MSLLVGRISMALALLLASAIASAQTDAATAETLMRKSGLWQQLAGVAPQMKQAMVNAIARGARTPSAAERERLVRAVDLAYAPERLRRSVLGSIGNGLQGGHVVVLLAWLDSPKGMAITRMEEQASTQSQDSGQKLREGTALLQKLSAERRTLLEQVVKVTKAAEMTTSMVINSSIAVQAGQASVSRGAPGLSSRELRAELDKQRPQMQQGFSVMMLAYVAKTYATLSDADLQSYTTFLQSEPGQSFNELAMRAVDAALVEAATDFGRRIPATKDASNT